MIAAGVPFIKKTSPYLFCAGEVIVKGSVDKLYGTCAVSVQLFKLKKVGKCLLRAFRSYRAVSSRKTVAAGKGATARGFVLYEFSARKLLGGSVFKKIVGSA